MPPGVINFVAGDAAMISKVLLSHRDLAGVHFTGSTEVFNDMWKTIGASMSQLPLLSAHRRRNRRQGLHRRAPVGRRRRAGRGDRARRLRVPGAEVLGGEPRLRAAVDVERRARSRRRDDRRHQDGRRPATSGTSWAPSSTSARSTRSADYIEHAREQRDDRRRRQGATASKGYFIGPTLVETADPGYRLLCEEIFGPVVTAYVYDDAKWEETLALVDRDVAVRADRRRVRAGSPRDRARRRRRCATRPATSTSTTSRPARSSASSRSAARARRARTTRPGRS